MCVIKRADSGQTLRSLPNTHTAMPHTQLNHMLALVRSHIENEPAEKLSYYFVIIIIYVNSTFFPC